MRELDILRGLLIVAGNDWSSRDVELRSPPGPSHVPDSINTCHHRWRTVADPADAGRRPSSPSLVCPIRGSGRLIERSFSDSIIGGGPVRGLVLRSMARTSSVAIARSTSSACGDRNTLTRRFRDRRNLGRLCGGRVSSDYLPSAPRSGVRRQRSSRFQIRPRKSTFTGNCLEYTT